MTLTPDVQQKLQVAINSTVGDAISHVAEQLDVYRGRVCYPKEGVEAIYLAQRSKS